ncbi:MAG: hypothetical protein K9L02_03670 [Acholeplasmataceae bacterium]|nr:hypothetical protein [Acholeplasmataceae bacterium]
MSKILVAYYSFEGTTELIAQAIAKMTQADLLSIKPVNELKSKGFSKYFWGGSQVFMKKAPDLIPFECDISQYDQIFIGSPIWAGTFAPPIKSFLKFPALVDKKIYFFYTHDGGPGKVEKLAKKAIESRNIYGGSHGFLNVKKNFDANVEIAKMWISTLK